MKGDYCVADKWSWISRIQTFSNIFAFALIKILKEETSKSTIFDFNFYFDEKARIAKLITKRSSIDVFIMRQIALFSQPFESIQEKFSVLKARQCQSHEPSPRRVTELICNLRKMMLLEY